MGIVILIVIGAIVLRICWALFRANKELDSMPTAARQALENSVARRKALIEADGLRQHEAYKRAHPVAGAFRKYNPTHYYIDNALNTDRYPRNV
jgi:hypothetical protein